MKKIVLYGAFDRYNYGDNLMPLLLEMYIKKHAKEVLDDHEIVFASISDSDLTRYLCRKTEGVDSVTRTLPENSSIVVVGGEVLCATSDALFMHMQNSLLMHTAFKVLRKFLPATYKKISKAIYSTSWDFPYIPDLKALPQGTKVIYNTIGGGIKYLNSNDLQLVASRLKNSDYISVRDRRTLKEVEDVCTATLVPDSAYIMSDLVDEDFFQDKLSATLKNSLPEKYFTFQAAPLKLGTSLNETIKSIKALHDQTGTQVVLLPIGYASGHDDFHLLKKIHARLPGETILLQELNVWEIMYTISRSYAFFGTSLHGIITAMSFNIPHFALNPAVTKLASFVEQWSIPPYNKSHDAGYIHTLPELITEQSIIDLTNKSSQNKALIHANNMEIINTIRA